MLNPHVSPAINRAMFNQKCLLQSEHGHRFEVLGVRWGMGFWQKKFRSTLHIYIILYIHYIYIYTHYYNIYIYICIYIYIILSLNISRYPWCVAGFICIFFFGGCPHLGSSRYSPAGWEIWMLIPPEYEGFPKWGYPKSSILDGWFSSKDASIFWCLHEKMIHGLCGIIPRWQTDVHLLGLAQGTCKCVYYIYIYGFVWK